MSQANITTTAATAAPATASTQERGNVLRLAVAQALAGANSTVVYAMGAVVGRRIFALSSYSCSNPPLSKYSPVQVGAALCALFCLCLGAEFDI
ncbi:hypothetical protein [Pararoseomonas baculiformis]|uniref:hypothetical protein n=1 Tax=Pararoseomonas baculiformis TaxID=2820812 RepID=UPI001FD77CE3|nr:hypothetical protein [Pararoseomonas baculiformis]